MGETKVVWAETNERGRENQIASLKAEKSNNPTEFRPNLFAVRIMTVINNLHRSPKRLRKRNTAQFGLRICHCQQKPKSNSFEHTLSYLQ